MGIGNDDFGIMNNEETIETPVNEVSGNYILYIYSVKVRNCHSFLPFVYERIFTCYYLLKNISIKDNNFSSCYFLITRRSTYC